MANSFCHLILGGERESWKELPDLVVDASCLVDDDEELFHFPGADGCRFLGATMSGANRYFRFFHGISTCPGFYFIVNNF